MAYEKNGTIGLIAGGGQFPLMIAKAARERGLRVAVVAHLDETDPAIRDVADELAWIQLGQLGHLIKALKRSGVKNAIMAGTITKRKMFGSLRPDLKGLAIMSKLAVFHDDDILSSIAEELAGEGIEIVSSTSYLPQLLAPPTGCLTKKKPDRSANADIEFGWKMAKELGRLDIGQCVVVKKKTVLAIEAIEGTDEAIRRGGRLSEQGAVVVKVSKPNQDSRFDVPTVGLETVRVMSEAKASVLAVEAGKTLMFDKPDMISYADREGISIISKS